MLNDVLGEREREREREKQDPELNIAPGISQVKESNLYLKMWMNCSVRVLNPPVSSITGICHLFPMTQMGSAVQCPQLLWESSDVVYSSTQSVAE